MSFWHLEFSLLLNSGPSGRPSQPLDGVTSSVTAHCLLLTLLTALSDPDRGRKLPSLYIFRTATHSFFRHQWNSHGISVVFCLPSDTAASCFWNPLSNTAFQRSICNSQTSGKKKTPVITELKTSQRVIAKDMTWICSGRRNLQRETGCFFKSSTR